MVISGLSLINHTNMTDTHKLTVNAIIEGEYFIALKISGLETYDTMTTHCID